MSDGLQRKLEIPAGGVDLINQYLLDEGNPLVKDFLATVAKFGTPEEINAKAEKARSLDYQINRLKELGSPYVADLEWLIGERDAGKFISVADYRKKVLGDKADTTTFADASAVTLEISACQYFPWVIAEAKKAIANGELMPGRIIRVRNMVEQTADHDVIAYVLDVYGLDASQVLGRVLGISSARREPIDQALHFYVD